MRHTLTTTAAAFALAAATLAAPAVASGAVVDSKAKQPTTAPASLKSYAPAAYPKLHATARAYAPVYHQSCWFSLRGHGHITVNATLSADVSGDFVNVVATINGHSDEPWTITKFTVTDSDRSANGPGGRHSGHEVVAFMPDGEFGVNGARVIVHVRDANTGYGGGCDTHE